MFHFCFDSESRLFSNTLRPYVDNEAEIVEHNVTPRDGFIVLACDGYVPPGSALHCSAMLGEIVSLCLNPVRTKAVG